MTEARLTGYRRYRVLKRLFRKPVLILQLEFEESAPPTSPRCGEMIKSWVDALPEHLLIEGTTI